MIYTYKRLSASFEVGWSTPRAHTWAEVVLRQKAALRRTSSTPATSPGSATGQRSHTSTKTST